jgi:tripartite-type tricarboxylate transporter receptor subunit TctC
MIFARLPGLVCGLALAAGAAGLATDSLAQAYPSKAVRIFVPYPPGGPVDGVARGLTQGLAAMWGQPVVIENRPGANEIIAAQAIAKSPADGYTLFLGSDAGYSQNPFLYAKLPYDPARDLAPISRVVHVNMVLIVKGDLPVSSLKEFVALMKKEGKAHNYGSAGAGGTTHLAMEGFKRDAGFEMTHVAYKGIAPAVSDMLAGAIDAMFAGMTAATPHLKSGKMKVLVISGPKRASALPDVPTFTEAGYPTTEASFYLGLSAPAGTPAPVVAKIAADVAKAVNDPAFQERFTKPFGFEAVGDTPEQFAAFLARDREANERRIRAVGVKLEY